MRDFSGGGIFPLPDVVVRAKEREIPCIRKRGRFSRTSYFLSTETSDRESIVETRPLSLFARTLVEPSWVNNSSREYLRIKEPLYIYIYTYIPMWENVSKALRPPFLIVRQPRLPSRTHCFYSPPW